MQYGNVLVDLAEGSGPGSPGEVSLRGEGGKAEQVAHDWQTEWPWDLSVALHTLCKRTCIVSLPFWMVQL
jgi:hypothetical protein